MSTKLGAKDGGKTVADELVAQSKALFDAAASEEQQLDMLDPISAEEMAEAQEDLGPHAGNLAVLRHARAKRKGRPRGAKNKRSDEFEAYISQFGPDPAVVLAQIAGTPEEVMVQRSRDIDPVKKRLSWGDARNIRIRCAEALLPYRHGKKPVTVDANIRGVVVVEEIGGGSLPGGVVIDAEPLGVMAIEDDAK